MPPDPRYRRVDRRPPRRAKASASREAPQCGYGATPRRRPLGARLTVAGVFLDFVTISEAVARATGDACDGNGAAEDEAAIVARHPVTDTGRRTLARAFAEPEIGGERNRAGGHASVIAVPIGFARRWRFLPSPPEAVEAQCAIKRAVLHGAIREPACGDGAISEILIARGYEVIS